MAGLAIVFVPLLGVGIGAGLGGFSGAVYGFVKSDFDGDIWSDLKQTGSIVKRAGSFAAIGGSVGLIGGIVTTVYIYNKQTITNDTDNVKKRAKYTRKMNKTTV